MQKIVYARLLQPQIYYTLSLGRPYRMKKIYISQKLNKDDILLYFSHVFKSSFSRYLIMLEEKFYIYTYWYEITYPL